MASKSTDSVKMSQPTMPKRKTYLQKRAFLSSNKRDTSVVTVQVEGYEYGGYDASFALSSGKTGSIGSGGGEFSMYCSIGDPSSVKDTNEQIENIIANLNEYKKAINTAAKDAQKF